MDLTYLKNNIRRKKSPSVKNEKKNFIKHCGGRELQTHIPVHCLVLKINLGFVMAKTVIKRASPHLIGSSNEAAR